MGKLILNNVFYTYFDDLSEKSSLIIDNFNCEIEQGSVVSIVGESGSGKTTLLKLIAGILQPQNGTISIDDKLITSPGPDRTLIFQEYNLFSWKTVKQNIEFGLIASGVDKAERKLIIEKLLELTHLKPHINAYPKDLSGGMKQRVAIARALAVNPKFILMDEPFAALDQLTRIELQIEIAKIHVKEKQTIILVTHNIDEALALSDRIIVISRSPARVILDINIDKQSLTGPQYLKYCDDTKKDIYATLKNQNHETIR